MPSPTLFSGQKATAPLTSSPFAFVLPPAEPETVDGAPKDFAALLALELAHHAASLGFGDASNVAAASGEKPAVKSADAASKQSLQLFPSFAESAASQLNGSATAHTLTGENESSASLSESAPAAVSEPEEDAQEEIDEYDMGLAPFMLAVDAQPLLQWKPRQTGKLSATYQELVKPESQVTSLALTNVPVSPPEQTVNAFDAPSFSPNFVPRTVADLGSVSDDELPKDTAEAMTDTAQVEVRITAPLSLAGQQLLESARLAFEGKHSTENVSQTAAPKLAAENTPPNAFALSVMPLLTPVNEPASPANLPKISLADLPEDLNAGRQLAAKNEKPLTRESPVMTEAAEPQPQAEITQSPWVTAQTAEVQQPARAADMAPTKAVQKMDRDSLAEVLDESLTVEPETFAPLAGAMNQAGVTSDRAGEAEGVYSFAELVSVRRQVTESDELFQPETPTVRDILSVEPIDGLGIVATDPVAPDLVAPSPALVQRSEPNATIVLSQPKAILRERAVSADELAAPPSDSNSLTQTPEMFVQHDESVAPQGRNADELNLHYINNDLTPAPMPLVEAGMRADQSVLSVEPAMSSEPDLLTNENMNVSERIGPINLPPSSAELSVEEAPAKIAVPESFVHERNTEVERTPVLVTQNAEAWQNTAAWLDQPLVPRESLEMPVKQPTVENTTVAEAVVSTLASVDEPAAEIAQSQPKEEIEPRDKKLSLDEAASDETSTAVGKLTEQPVETRQTDVQPTMQSQILNAGDWMSAAQQTPARPLNVIPTGELRAPVVITESVARSGSLHIEKAEASAAPPVLNRVPTSKLPFIEQLAAANAREAEMPVNKGESAVEGKTVTGAKPAATEAKADATRVAEPGEMALQPVVEEVAAATAPAKKYTVSRGGSGRFGLQTLHEAARPASAVDASAETNLAAPQMTALSGTQVANSESAEAEEALPVVQQLAQPLVTASEQLTPGEHKTLKLKLRPEELGQVDIELTRDAAGRLHAHFTVEHDQTQRVLREELGQLRTALEQAGWQVEQLAISTQQPHFGGQAGGQSAQQGPTDSTPFSLPEQEPLDPEPTSKGGLPTAQDRLLNLHA